MSEDDTTTAITAMQEIEGALEEQATREDVALVARRLELEELPSQVLSNAISQEKLAELWGKTPEHAIKFRPGPGGGSLAYVPHGFVEFRLNKVFGGDWDIEPMPVFNGSVFHLQSFDVVNKAGKKSVNHSVTVCCKLTIRVRDPKTMEVVTTITKTEFGSAWWYPENEFGDALKSAESDALKRCGLRLGIALDLYYNDDRAREETATRKEASRKLAEEVKEAKLRKQRATAPASVPDLILRAKETYGVALKELLALLYQETKVTEGMTRLSNDLTNLGADKLWSMVVAACQPSNVTIDQPPTEANG